MHHFSTPERLKDLGLLDASPQQSFENLTQLASKVIGAPVSLVSIVDFEGDRQFFKSQLGLPEPWASRRETPLSHSFCQHVVRNDRSLIVENAPEHELVSDNPAIRDLDVVAYLGVPIYSPENQPVGALCVIDHKPRAWDYEEVKLAKQLAQCVSDAIRLNAALAAAAEAQQQQQRTTEALATDLYRPVERLSAILDELKVESSVLSADLRGHLDEALGMLRRIGRQVGALVGYSRTLNDRGSRVPIDMDELLGDVLRRRKGDFLSLGAEITAMHLPVIYGDESQIRSMLDHLIDNALMFRKPDTSPLIEITSGQVSGQRGLWIAVRDNGIGIAEEDQARVFSLMTRLPGSGAPEGAGVGLSLCRQVAENHLGRIEVQSEPGKGSTFTVYLPDPNS